MVDRKVTVDFPSEIGPAALRDMILANHDEAEGGHARLRGDLRAIEARLRSVEQEQLGQKRQITELGSAPIEVSTLRFTPQMVFALLAVCASIVGGQKWSTWGWSEEMSATRSDVRDINTKMDAMRQHNDDYIKLQDERATTMSKAIGEIKAQQQMQDLKTNNLRETVLTNRTR